jgi:hypothetical protein
MVQGLVWLHRSLVPMRIVKVQVCIEKNWGLFLPFCCRPVMSLACLAVVQLVWVARMMSEEQSR